MHSCQNETNSHLFDSLTFPFIFPVTGCSLSAVKVALRANSRSFGSSVSVLGVNQPLILLLRVMLCINLICKMIPLYLNDIIEVYISKLNIVI